MTCVDGNDDRSVLIIDDIALLPENEVARIQRPSTRTLLDALVQENAADPMTFTEAEPYKECFVADKDQFTHMSDTDALAVEFRFREDPSYKLATVHVKPEDVSDRNHAALKAQLIQARLVG